MNDENEILKILHLHQQRSEPVTSRFNGYGESFFISKLAICWMGAINLIQLFTVNCISSVLPINTSTLEIFLKKKILSRDLNMRQLSSEASMLTTLIYCPLPNRKSLRWISSEL